ncbi:multiple sugar transport system permease protein [Cryobacterium sp. CAN_C3]|uniref:carbohydrate ABC transporter permease n=1 Tax=unclassified Cryobacterium TaxID=2649013 RepID=UPI0018C91359|nr:multiple sugar transport system permease protein [Cryobacterium sp. CAN_C3]
MNAVTTPHAPAAVAPESTPSPRPRKRSISWRLRTGAGLSYLMLSVLALVYIYPFLITVSSAFKSDDEATNDPLRLIPQTWSFASFERLFTDVPLPLWTMNTVFVTITITLGRVFFDSLAGYALSRLRFRGRGLIFAALVAVMAVPGVVLLIPRFLILKQFGMYDSYAGMIVPLLVDAAGIFIMKQFFESIPSGVEEAARLDGAGVFRTFWTIVLPMARPALVTLFILSFQGSWNEFGHFIVSRQSPETNTLTTGIASLFSGQLGSGNEYPLKMAAAVLMTIPVAIMFFVFQKRLTNTTEGSEKG